MSSIIVMSYWIQQLKTAVFGRVPEPIVQEQPVPEPKNDPVVESAKGHGHEESAEVDIDQIPPIDLLITDPCNTCSLPCDDHKAYPTYLKFDHTSPLLGSMKPYSRHVLIGTGQSDWAERIEEDWGTFAANLTAVTKDRPVQNRAIITNTSMVNTYSQLPNSHDIVILPDNIIVSNVTPDDAEAFFEAFLATPLPVAPVMIEDYSTRHLKNMVVHKNPYDSMILICSHRKRDKLCGVTAEILGTEFDNVLREKDICEGEGGTAVLMVSHVGGHKFAGNVICITHNGTRCIWYGRVKACHCERIVDDTIIGGRVLKELYRGAMSHSYDESKCERVRW
ncbi:Sucrase/ferredoxin-like-domain-containing protein [Phycomyces nitens]|nr:Sucrase/ferredoxin-like-domain-containing protein [Phycomyces nitens]